MTVSGAHVFCVWQVASKTARGDTEELPDKVYSKPANAKRPKLVNLRRSESYFVSVMRRFTKQTFTLTSFYGKLGSIRF